MKNKPSFTRFSFSHCINAALVVLLTSLLATDVSAAKPAAEHSLLQITAADLRSGRAGAAQAVILTDKQGDVFLYNPTSTAKDDNAMVITAKERRYERVIKAEIQPEWWGAVGDMKTDDYNALQACIDYAKQTGTTVRLTKSYKFTKGLVYTRDAQFSAGLKMIGSGIDSTRLMPSGVEGPALFIDGNTSGTPGHHMNDVLLRGFTLTQEKNSTTATHGIEVRALQNSTLENLKIQLMGGDGIRVIATTPGDTGACEVMTFKNLYIMRCKGWGFIATGTQKEAIPLTVSLLDKVFVNSCHDGMYFQGLQMVKIHNCVSVSATNYNLKFGRGTTACHLVDIDHMELGNNFVPKGSAPTAKMLSMEYIQHLRANRVRFINNPTEFAVCGIEFGSQPDSYLFDVEINEPWIVQANPDLTNYEWLRFDPIVPARENIRVKLPQISAFVAGKMTNDLSRVSYYQDEYSHKIVDFAEREKEFTNESAITPDLEHKLYRITSNQPSLDITIHNPIAGKKYPGQAPKHGEIVTFIVRNISGLSSVKFGDSFKVNDASIPAAGSHKVYTFKWYAGAKEWYQM